MRKWLLNSIVVLLASTFLLSLFLFLPAHFQSLDNRLRDFLFLMRGPIDTTKNVVIIDIDEKSIKELGQWPWERDIFAKLLLKLSEAQVGIIGLDIVFSESDKTSLSYLAKKYNLSIANPQDNDTILGDAVSKTPTILGYVFDMSGSSKEKRTPDTPAIVIEKNLTQSSSMLNPKGVLLNIEAIQSKAYSSGFFNNLPDESGMVRSVPLIMKYSEQIYTSLSLEMIRIALNASTVTVNYNEVGVESIGMGNIVVPTDYAGRLFVNYRGAGKTFKYLSAVDIISGDFDPKEVEGKFVLVGTSAIGLLDLRAMPFDEAYPGVEVHANAIDNILTGDFLVASPWAVAVDMLLIVLTFAGSFLLFNLLSAASIFLVALFEFVGVYYFLQYMLFSQGVILNILFPFLSLAFAVVLATLMSYFFETRLKNVIKGKFANKVSQSVMEDILEHADSSDMGGVERELTVFFSDVRNFTNISEAIGNPKRLISLMNDYMDPMTEIIIEERGTVDKFIGDAIMAYWNAPQNVEDHADRAVRASLRQLEALEGLNRKIEEEPEYANVVSIAKKEGRLPIDIGIGLNTGVAIVGEMGSRSRSDYTVIGDPINLGSRLESLCKYYGSRLNISNFTKDKLTKEYIFRFLDLVRVKGKKEPVQIWQIYGFGRAEGKLKEELKLYHHGVELYKKMLFGEALDIFKEVEARKDKSNKKIYKIYISRCKHYISEPPTNFTGVFEHSTKG